MPTMKENHHNEYDEQKDITAGNVKKEADINIKVRLMILTLVMAISCIAITLTVLNTLYKHSIMEYHQLLQVTVQSQAKLIEAIADYNLESKKLSGDDESRSETLLVTLSQVREAHENFKGFEKTGEFTLAQRSGDKIEFLLSHRLGGFDEPASIDFDSTYAEPMRRALGGKSGTVIGLDYRGKEVLAAYDYIEPLGLGLVVKIDLSEVQEIFVKSGWGAAGITILVILSGIIVFYWISKPVIGKLKSDANRLRAENQQRRKSEESLALQNERIEAIIVGMNVGSWEWDIESGEVILNERFADIIGYKLKDLPSRSFKFWKKFCHPDDIELVENALNKCLEGVEKYFRCEFRIKHKSNSWAWVLGSGKVESWSETGKPRWVYGTIYDISHRKEIEESLHTNEEVLRLTFEQSPLGVCLSDLTGKILSVNKAYESFTGYSMEELTTISLFDITYSDDLRMNRDAVKKLLEQKIMSFVFENRYIHKDGSVITGKVHSRLIVDSSKKPIYMITLVEDFTKQKSIERERKLLSEAIAQIDDIVVVTNNKAQIEYVNPAFERVTGYTAEEVYGKNPRILKSGEHPLSFYKDMWNTISHGNTWQGKIRNQRKNGDVYTEEAVISPVMSEESNVPIYYIAIKRDITNRLELEHQLHHSEKMAAVGQLAGGVAHDFNNQLTGILGFAYLLKGCSTDSHLTNYADKIIAAGERAGELTNKLLSFSRKDKDSYTIVDIHNTIHDVISMLERIIDKRISITSDCQAALSTVHGDPNQLNNVLLNMGINARDAMPDGGELSFTTKQVELTHEEIVKSGYNLSPGTFICINVSDTGQGISQELQSRIFEPFYTTKEKGEGTGLGLSSAYGTVSSHNGRVSVSSVVNQGATFEILLPVLISKRTDDSESSWKRTSGEGTILVVDDEETVRDIATCMLNFLGYTVETCKDGLEAVEFYKESSESIDLVILDMIMPKLNGHDTYMEMLKVNPDVKVICITGYSIEEQINGLLENGVKALVKKPFSEDELSEVVARVMNDA